MAYRMARFIALMRFIISPLIKKVDMIHFMDLAPGGKEKSFSFRNFCIRISYLNEYGVLMKFTALGGCGEIGANSYHLEIDGTGILLDAGIHPKRYGLESLPMLEALRRREVHAILISHCHIDHLGALPVILKYFPTPRIFLTAPSFPISMRMLHNTVTVMERLKEEKGVTEYPFYTHQEIDMITNLFQTMDYDHPFRIPSMNGSHRPDLEGTFFDAGHILGSAGTFIRGKEGTVFYTGDTCRHDQTVIKGAIYPKEEIDLLILENTLCSSVEAERRKRGNEIQRLAAEIRRVIARGGTILIPTFALGRTQEILSILDRLKKRDRIPNVPILVSGMGKVFSKIYDRFALQTRRKDPELLFKNIETKSLNSKNSLLNRSFKKPSIIVATSGMLSERTPANQLTHGMIEDPRHAIFFVGYLDEDTPGFQLLNTSQGQEVTLDVSLPPRKKVCDVLSFRFSAHSHRTEILRIVEDLTPRKVILIHGEKGAVGWTAEMIRQRDNGIEVIVPEAGQEISL
jgi:Cft2 family RNA processing exonuclease